MKNGWIKLHRKLLDNPLAKRPNFLSLWIHLLLKANHEDQKFMWNGNVIIIKEGQILTGRKELSKETGIPEGTIEGILTAMEKNQQQIQQQKTTKYRVITIINWTEYQSTDNKSNNKPTTNEQQTDTYKNVKNIKNDKNNNILIISDELKNKYSPALLTDFLLYWEEKDSKGNPRWKKEKTWETEKRLIKWKRNQEKWDYEKSNRNRIFKEEDKRTPRVYTGAKSITDIIKQKYGNETVREMPKQ